MRLTPLAVILLSQDDAATETAPDGGADTDADTTMVTASWIDSTRPAPRIRPAS